MLKCLGTCTVWQKQHSARCEFPVKPQWQLDQLTLSIEQIECTAGLWAVYILNVLMLYSQWIQRKHEKTTLYQHSKFNQQTTCMSLRDWYLGQEWECEITLVLQFDHFPVDVVLCQAFYSETLESLSSMSQTCEELHVMIKNIEYQSLQQCWKMFIPWLPWPNSGNNLGWSPDFRTL